MRIWSLVIAVYKCRSGSASLIFLPSLVEEHVCSLGDDGALLGLGDAAVVKVVPLVVYPVLAVRSI